MARFNLRGLCVAIFQSDWEEMWNEDTGLKGRDMQWSGTQVWSPTAWFNAQLHDFLAAISASYLSSQCLKLVTYKMKIRMVAMRMK